MVDIQALEASVEKIEQIVQAGSKDPVRAVQIDLLRDLYRLKNAIVEDCGIPPEDESETIALKDKLRKLQEENGKLKYRISHLKQHLA